MKACIQNLVQIGTVVSKKIQFDFFMFTTLGLCQEMTLTFNTHTSSYSNKCLFLLPLRGLAAIVSEKSTVFTFSYRKSEVTKFDHAVK